MRCCLAFHRCSLSDRSGVAGCRMCDLAAARSAILYLEWARMSGQGRYPQQRKEVFAAQQLTSSCCCSGETQLATRILAASRFCLLPTSQQHQQQQRAGGGYLQASARRTFVPWPGESALQISRLGLRQKVVDKSHVTPRISAQPRGSSESSL